VNAVTRFVLKLKSRPRVPVDVRHLRPDDFAGRQIDEILRLRVWEGSVKTQLGELFEVVEAPKEAPADPKLIEVEVLGDTGNKFRYLGFKMSGGRIVVRSDGGHLVGYKMSGGSIVVEGNVDHWLGAKMRGGEIEVRGNAGSFVGAKLMGEKPGKGMRGGTIVVRGSAGSYIGFGMGGGTIIIEGNAGDAVGAYMVGGSILVKGSAGYHHGVSMTGGRIVICGRVANILPGFYIDSMVDQVKVKGITMKKQFAVFIGDAVVNGRGTLAISYEDNGELLESLKALLS